MALAHKGLEKDAVVELIRFSDKEKLAFSGQKLVPVIVDGDRVVNDSFAIALYLMRLIPMRRSSAVRVWAWRGSSRAGSAPRSSRSSPG